MAPSTMNGKQRGHMLLVVLVLTTLLSLIMAMAIQPVRTTKQRMKEAELVYRGEHLADGIRRFYAKKGRFPFELEELIEAEPRFIRQLYTDPMNKEGEWELIYLAATDHGAIKGLDAMVREMLANIGEPIDKPVEKPKEEGEKKESIFSIKNRQITGVRSKSDEEGLRVYNDSRLYSDWEFTALPKTKIGLKEALESVGGR